MIIFIYGDNDYASIQKLNQIKEKFREKSGGLNISEVDFGDRFEKRLDFNRLSNELLAAPFLSKSRLVIFRNFLKEAEASLSRKFIPFLKRIPKSTIVIFFEKGTPDKKSSFFQALLKIAKHQEFASLPGFALVTWIMDEVEKRGGKISREAAVLLAGRSNENLWIISTEIDKLVISAKGKEIDEEMVRALVADISESQIFALVDALAARNLKLAMRELSKLRRKEPELYIFKMVIFGFRNLLLVADYLESKKERNYNTIAKKLKIHPYVVQKTLVALKNFDLKELEKIYGLLLKTDREIKTGKREVSLALDLLVIKLCLSALPLGR